MTFIDTLRTLFEIFMVGGLILCIFNEKRLIAFEERVLSALRRKRLRVIKTDRAKRHIA